MLPIDVTFDTGGRTERGRKQKNIRRNDTIIVIFYTANTKKDNANVVLASSNS